MLGRFEFASSRFSDFAVAAAGAVDVDKSTFVQLCVLRSNRERELGCERSREVAAEIAHTTTGR